MLKSNVTPYTTSATGGKIVTKVHQSLLAGSTALALLVTLACGGGGGSDDADDPPTTARDTSTSAQPTTTALSPQDSVRAAYESFVAMIDRITTTTVDPNDPELTMRLVDPALSVVRTQLSTVQAQGQVVVRGDLTRHDIESVEVNRDGATAVVTDCIVSNDTLAAVGTILASFPPPRTQRGTATLVNQNGAWLVQDTDPGEQWEGVAGCAA
jgi:hypothetical protein